MSSLVIEDLHVRYGPIAAVRGVSLTCAAGELVALLGPNGAGKSSTMLAVSGALYRSGVSGSITFDGRPLHGCRPEEISRAGVVLVPERRRIFAPLTVRENLLVGASGWATRRAAEEHVGTLLERFPALGAARDRHGGLLSGGQQQQLAIARALMARPRFLLLDEPSLGLSPNLVQVVFDIVRGLCAEGIGVLLVEQQVAQTMAVADRALAMRKGRIEGQVDDRESELLAASYFGTEQQGAKT
jgi:branched-chain amino acid transport system ATP-binding protein